MFNFNCQLLPNLSAEASFFVHCIAGAVTSGLVEIREGSAFRSDPQTNNKKEHKTKEQLWQEVSHLSASDDLR